VKNLIKNISKNLNSKFFFEHDTSKNVWFQAGGLASVFCLVHNEKELQLWEECLRMLENDKNGHDQNIINIITNGDRPLFDSNKIIADLDPQLDEYLAVKYFVPSNGTALARRLHRAEKIKLI
jgi:hypothetical protein